MEVVCKHVERVHRALKSLGVHHLEVCVLRRKDNGQTTRSESGAQLLHQIDLVLLVDSSVAATSVGARPLPVDVDTCEVPLLEKVEQGGDEGLAVGLGARHERPSLVRRAGVGELPST